MPAAHLIPPAAARTTETVRDVFVGANLALATARASLTADNLADAIDAYHVAGITALEQRDASRWHQVRVRLVDQHAAERTLAMVIGPGLDSFIDDGGASGWWFMRKEPGL